SRKYGWITPFQAHGARRSTAGCSDVSEVWWIFDQVVPTLLRNSVWSAIVLVPSYTRKMKPRARHNRPKNLKTNRIMASCGFEGMCVARLSHTPLGGSVQLSASVPIPKFASERAARPGELRNRTTSAATGHLWTRGQGRPETSRRAQNRLGLCSFDP